MLILFRQTRRETDLSNLIANASARDELFDHNAHVSVMKLEMTNIQKKGEEYEKCVQSVRNLSFFHVV